MAPKKGDGNKKGKSPAKKQVPQVSPPQSSSDDESWAMLRQFQDKKAIWEAKGLERQGPKYSEATPRRSARDTKGRHRAKMRAITLELTKRFDALEAEQGHEVGGQNMDEGPSAAPLGSGERKRRRMEAADYQDAFEGRSYGHDPYDEPSTSSQGAVGAPRTAVDTGSEYKATHNTLSQSASWPWFGGLQQPIASPNPCASSPMMWPGGFCPPISPQWFGWGMPFTNPIKRLSPSESKNLGTQ